jgi:uncharacterized membrane protein
VEVMEAVRSAMEWAAFALDTFAVAVILGGIVIAAFRCRLIRTIVSPDSPGVVSKFKHQLVSSLLLGLDLLVASDVIHTAALEPTLYGVATLGLLVIVRIALTWSLIVEAEGRWPWEPGDESR